MLTHAVRGALVGADAVAAIGGEPKAFGAEALARDADSVVVAAARADFACLLRLALHVRGHRIAVVAQRADEATFADAAARPAAAKTVPAAPLLARWLLASIARPAVAARAHAAEALAAIVARPRALALGRRLTQTRLDDRRRADCPAVAPLAARCAGPPVGADALKHRAVRSPVP